MSYVAVDVGGGGGQQKRDDQIETCRDIPCIPVGQRMSAYELLHKSKTQLFFTRRFF